MDWSNPSYSRLPEPLFEVPIADFSLPVILIPEENLPECLRNKGIKIYALLGFMAPPGSIKRIPAGYMIERAVQTGLVCPGGTLAEPTSGNIGVAMAYCASCYDIKVVTIVSDSLPGGKLLPLRHHGAIVVKESEAIRMLGLERHPGSVELARQYAQTTGAVFLNQYGNSWNPQSYERLVAPGLWEGTRGNASLLVSAIGSTGTLIGLGRYFKERKPNIEIIATKPYFGQKIDGTRGDDRLWEITHDRRPLVSIEEPIDEITARAYSARLNKHGIPAGPSSGAAFGSAIHILLTKLGGNTLDSMRGKDGSVGVIIPFADTLYPYA
ncbi:MAG: pyridoxal-phosphate dependent enzyme [Minisyncoccia bacterium]